MGLAGVRVEKEDYRPARRLKVLDVVELNEVARLASRAGTTISRDRGLTTAEAPCPVSLRE